MVIQLSSKTTENQAQIHKKYNFTQKEIELSNEMRNTLKTSTTIGTFLGSFYALYSNTRKNTTGLKMIFKVFGCCFIGSQVGFGVGLYLCSSILEQFPDKRKLSNMLEDFKKNNGKFSFDQDTDVKVPITRASVNDKEFGELSSLDRDKDEVYFGTPQENNKVRRNKYGDIIIDEN